MQLYAVAEPDLGIVPLWDETPFRARPGTHPFASLAGHAYITYKLLVKLGRITILNLSLTLEISKSWDQTFGPTRCYCKSAVA